MPKQDIATWLNRPAGLLLLYIILHNNCRSGRIREVSVHILWAQNANYKFSWQVSKRVRGSRTANDSISWLPRLHCGGPHMWLDTRKKMNITCRNQYRRKSVNVQLSTEIPKFHNTHHMCAQRFPSAIAASFHCAALEYMISGSLVTICCCTKVRATAPASLLSCKSLPAPSFPVHRPANPCVFQSPVWQHHTCIAFVR